MSNMSDTIEVQVVDRTVGADGVVQLELKNTNGKPLPPFEPGAHVDVHLANGLIRQYSLCNFQPEPDTYEIAVGLAEMSRGGSSYMHDKVAIGAIFQISVPRNNFVLVPDASTYIFVAGGIGVTPILSMIRWCEMSHKNWQLLYTVRSRKRAAYLEQLLAFGGDRIHLHFDDEKEGYADVKQYLACLREGDHVYCCGPEPLMNAVEQATLDHPRNAVHFERFAAPASDASTPDTAFVVRLKRSNMDVPVSADKSILESIEEAGIALPFSCREGLCRSCETTVCSGVPDHRDYVLSDEERDSNTTMMICVSRSKSSILELDI
jgi:ferredoxin-NADP reductase